MKNCTNKNYLNLHKGLLIEDMNLYFKNTNKKMIIIHLN